MKGKESLWERRIEPKELQEASCHSFEHYLKKKKKEKEIL